MLTYRYSELFAGLQVFIRARIFMDDQHDDDFHPSIKLARFG